MPAIPLLVSHTSFDASFRLLESVEASQDGEIMIQFVRRYGVRVLLGATLLALLSGVMNIWLPYQRDLRLSKRIESVGGIAILHSPDEYLLSHGLWELHAQVPVFARLAEVQLHEEVPSDLLEDILQCRSLSLLLVTGRNVRDADLKNLQKMTELSHLSLLKTSISDLGLKNLRELSYLDTLDLSETEIGDEGLRFLRELPLVQIALADTKVTDEGLEQLAGATGLRSIYLDKTNIGDLGLLHLRGLFRLERLDAISTPISDAGLVHLRGLNNLDYLDLNNTQTTVEGRDMLRKALPKCRIFPQP
ncbi:MAG: hypothetical protein JWP89_6985 [Schlesneria sp.]|nr:hypothetical protein [Schlesneria sp.]